MDVTKIIQRAREDLQELEGLGTSPMISRLRDRAKDQLELATLYEDLLRKATDQSAQIENLKSELTAANCLLRAAWRSTNV